MFMLEAVMYTVCKNVVENHFREEGIIGNDMPSLVSYDDDLWTGVSRLLHHVKRLLTARKPEVRHLIPATSQGAAGH